jgi:hypothetical protein
MKRLLATLVMTVAVFAAPTAALAGTQPSSASSPVAALPGSAHRSASLGEMWKRQVSEPELGERVRARGRERDTVPR